MMTVKRLIALGFILALAGIHSHTILNADTIQFTDVSSTAGIQLTGKLTESLAWGDYDNDGDQDLYLTNNFANKLYRNDGNDLFTDVTVEAGVDNNLFSVGTAFGDLDNDGDLDLYVVNFNAGPDVLYRNEGPVGPGGVYVFSDVTEAAGTTITRSSRGMAFLDYDRDGLLDIYVLSIGASMLYHNLGNLKFEDVAADLGVEASATNVGVVATDVDDNGWMDLFIGNRSSQINHLFLNDNGAFTEVAAAAGIDKVGLGMGVLSFDYDNDLDFDLYWTNWPDNIIPFTLNALYENQGNATFVDMTAFSGTQDPDGWGISCNAGDIDLDGWQDFFITNGFDLNTSPNVLFHNQQNKKFTDITSTLGGADFDGRGVAFADYDNDGDLDLCVTSSDSNFLWRNDTITDNHWITFDLTGVTSNRSAIGARILVEAGSLRIVQEVSGGAGRGSFNSLPVEFGLGSQASVDRAIIRWPDGTLQVVENPPIDQFVQIVEEDTWFDLNEGNPGTAGKTPRMAATGDLSPNSQNSVRITDALPGAKITLVAGFSSLNVPFAGGLLIPALDILLPLGNTSAEGTVSLAFVWPSDIVPGTEIYVQGWISDAGAFAGLSATNGVVGTSQ
jgi:hypothetical protein